MTPRPFGPLVPGCPGHQDRRHAVPRPLAAAVLLLIDAAAAPAAAYTAGSCVPGQRCETWSAVVDNPDIRAPERSDQFTVAVLSSATTTFVVTKDVALNPADPYAASGRALVVAFDRASGQRLWQVGDSAASVVLPWTRSLRKDGTRLYVTGGAYDGYPTAARSTPAA